MRTPHALAQQFGELLRAAKIKRVALIIDCSDEAPERPRPLVKFVALPAAEKDAAEVVSLAARRGGR